jgi:hypothetical protein
MLEHRVHLSIEDWDDVGFREEVEEAWARVCLSPDDVDPTTAAAHLQLLVRSAGYPQAVVAVHRTVDEALAHVAHFEVSRQPRAALIGA